MLFHGSGIKRLAVESIIALTLAWASLQLGQVYASEGQCSGLTALGPIGPAVETNVFATCNKETLSGE